MSSGHVVNVSSNANNATNAGTFNVNANNAASNSNRNIGSHLAESSTSAAIPCSFGGEYVYPITLGSQGEQRGDHQR